MKDKLDNLLKTNKYLTDTDVTEGLVAASATSSTLVEGVRIQNPFLSHLPLNVKIETPKNPKLWD